jgi:hypothetical protein
MHKVLAVAACALFALPVATAAHAEGNLASNGTSLAINIDAEQLTLDTNRFEIETGKYYKLAITVTNPDDTALVMPELFRNVWINQIVVDDLEIKVQTPYSLEWDADGTFTVTFVPIRPGEYDFWVPGYESRGLKGTFVVK